MRTRSTLRTRTQHFTVAAVAAAALVMAAGTAWAQTWLATGPSNATTALVADPAQPMTVYMSQISGVFYRSTNGGGTWSTIPTTWLPSGNWIMATGIDTSTTPHTIYAGWSGVYKTTNDGASWTSDIGGLGSVQNEYATSIAVDNSTTPRRIYAGSDTAGVYWSNDGGASWTLGNGFASTITSIARAVAIDPAHAGTVFAGFDGDGCWKSTDYGVSWTNTNIPYSSVTGLAFDANNDLYASTNGGSVYRLPSGSTTWSASLGGMSSYVLYCIAADPTTAGTLYVGDVYGSGVFKTTTSGASWSALNTGLTNLTINKILTTPGTVYAATDGGAFMFSTASLAVTGLSPASGPPGGGTAVTITGTGFAGTTAVKFGTTSATSFTVDSATQITATNPPGTGTVNVTVTTLAGTSATGAGSQFAYVLPPSITSANATTFTVGSAGTFTVTATGYPTTMTYGVTGTLPTGVTFSTTTGVLSGTPAAGTGGNYPLTVTASNGITPNATQSFTLTVNAAPSITSANAATFTVGSAGTFTVTATGYPTAMTYGVTGMLPTNVALNTTTGVLSGTPAAGTGGSYPLTITASNGITPYATQSFTLTVQSVTSFSGSTATGTGTATASFTGGGVACTFASAAFVPASSVGTPAPVLLPHGLFEFTLQGCTGAVTMTITYPSPLPVGTAYWKFGPASQGASPSWYRFTTPLTASTDTFTITLNDGALGDDDWAVNGTIVDQGGPGYPGEGIPALGRWGLALLALLLGAASVVALRRLS